MLEWTVLSKENHPFFHLLPSPHKKWTMDLPLIFHCSSNIINSSTVLPLFINSSMDQHFPSSTHTLSICLPPFTEVTLTDDVGKGLGPEAVVRTNPGL